MGTRHFMKRIKFICFTFIQVLQVKKKKKCMFNHLVKKQDISSFYGYFINSIFQELLLWLLFGITQSFNINIIVC